MNTMHSMTGRAQGTVNTPATNQVSHTELCWPGFPILCVATTVAIILLTSSFKNKCGRLNAQRHHSCKNSKLMEINSDIPLCGHIFKNFIPLHKEKYIHTLISQINFITWFSYVHQLFKFTFTDIIYNMFKA
jgi:hypothetical protein